MIVGLERAAPREVTRDRMEIFGEVEGSNYRAVIGGGVMLKLKWVWVAVLVVLLGGAGALASGSNDYRSGATILSLNRPKGGTISYSSDTVDWYKVYVPESGVFVVFMDGYQEKDIDLYLYNAAGDLLAQDISVSEDGVVYGRVAGGWYYIKIKAAFSSYGSIDYDIGALFVDHSTGYLRSTESVNFHSLYMSASRVYWIFLVDTAGFFDPDLFLAYGDEVLASSRSTGNIDVIKWYPSFSGTYIVAAGSAQGSGHYYILVGSKTR